MNEKLLGCMSLFSLEKLKAFLGRDIVEQVIQEWTAFDDQVLTKRKCAEMILQLNGSTIFASKDFREELLRHMTANEVNDIYALTKFAGASTLEEKTKKIASLSWGSSPANRHFISLFGYDESIFAKEEQDTQSFFYQEAGERFYELLDYQFVIKQRIINELNRPFELKRMLVHMPTGTGKTKTTMHALVQYFDFDLKKQGLILWLAHTTELLEQAYSTFVSVWSRLGDKTVQVYKIWGNRNIPEHENLTGVMFCGIQKLQAIQASQPEQFQRIVQAARVIVFDEAHKAAAPETKKLVNSLMIKKSGMEDRSLIGLTATPGRTSLSIEENALLANLFENRLITIDIDLINKINKSTLEYLNTVTEDNIMRYFQARKILSKITKEELTYQASFTDAELKKIKTKVGATDKDFTKEALKVIGEKRERNAAILRRLRELFIQRKPTIVFACSVAHAKLLSFMLSLEDIPNGVVLGEMNAADRAAIIQAFKDPANPLKILINCEVLTTGFDSTNIECVFITRPTQSIVLYSQMIGRGLRGPLMGGNEECLLIDVKDNLDRFDAEMAFNHFDAYWN